MGHWTTYRRRGSKPSAADVLPLPLTPILTAPGNVISTTSAGGNTGGTAQLWKATTEFGVYSLATPMPWTTVVNFGSTVIYNPGWIKSVNVGDGRNFSNQSPFSNVIFLP
jgi:hypothetical protein